MARIGRHRDGLGVVGASVRRCIWPSAQLLTYLACSGCAAIVNFVAGSVIIGGLRLSSPIGFEIAVSAGYGLGMAVNFALNRRFTFADAARDIGEQAGTFATVAIVGLALTNMIAPLGRDLFMHALPIGAVSLLFARTPLTPDALGRAVAIVIVAFYSFAAHKYLTFGRGLSPRRSQCAGAAD